MESVVQMKKTRGTFRLDVEFQGHSNRIGILGASGCGKSMALQLLAGIASPSQGYISIGGNVLFDSRQRINKKPQQRRIGYLFQNYALFPTMTVAENIGAGLRGRKPEKRRRVEEMMEKFQLTHFADRLPGELSGGQHQHTALARIMAYEPDVILLDEPFSALDVYLKDQMQKELEELLKDYQGLVVLVSHSRDEIYRFCQELLVMAHGRCVVYGKTREIFARPLYREAAVLTGCKNIADIRRMDAHRMEVDGWGISLLTQGEIPEDITCIGYRAHDFVPIWGQRKRNCLEVHVKSMAEMPFEYNYYLQPEEHGKGSPICWFVQKEKHQLIKEKGLPDYLEIREDCLMLLK